MPAQLQAFGGNCFMIVRQGCSLTALLELLQIAWSKETGPRPYLVTW